MDVRSSHRPSWPTLSFLMFCFLLLYIVRSTLMNESNNPRVPVAIPGFLPSFIPSASPSDFVAPSVRFGS